MDEKVKEFLEKAEQEEQRLKNESIEKEKFSILKEANLAEKVYTSNITAKNYESYYDPLTERYFHYNYPEVSEEELEKIKQVLSKKTNNRNNKNKKVIKKQPDIGYYDETTIVEAESICKILIIIGAIIKIIDGIVEIDENHYLTGILTIIFSVVIAILLLKLITPIFGLMLDVKSLRNDINNKR